MDEFCGQPFWDTNLTWNTNNEHEPDFTTCFEATVLAWIPCAFLWVFGLINLCFKWNCQAKLIPWTSLNLTKCGLTIILTLLQIALLFRKLIFKQKGDITYPVEIVTPIVRGLTYCLALLLINSDKSKGTRSSGILFNFWLLSSICELFAFRTMLLQASDPETTIDAVDFVINMLFYPLIIGQLLLTCWADAAPKFERPAEMTLCPEERASYLSQLTFSWFDSLAWTGFRKPLEYSDLWDLNNADKSRAVVPALDKYWEKSKKLLTRSPSLEKSSPPTDQSTTSLSVKFREPLVSSEKQVSILPVLFRAFGSTFLYGTFLKLVQDILMFVSPQILRLLIAFVSGDEEEWKGYFYTIIMFATAVIQTIFLAQYFHKMFLVGMRIRAALVSAIYRKALVISTSARNSATVGEIVNLMSVDVQKIQDLIPYVSLIWSGPLQICLAIYFLWQTLGPSVLSGLALMILMIPVNSVIARKMEQLQMIQMKNKDQRVKLMNEILSGIKVLKLYAWESSFQEQVLQIREKEMKVLKTAAYLDSGIAFIWQCAPFLVSLVTFATYVLVDDKNVLDAQKAFVSLTLLNILSAPLALLPMVVSSLVQASVSLKRLNKFMNSEEIDRSAVSHDENEGDPIVIENGMFSWTTENKTLKDINIRIKEGSLCAVVGEVGCGKSSLLSAILGELFKDSGRVNTKGKTAYVGQQAWIQNATVRDNVLFGLPFDWKKYDKILECCALKPDLEILPAGDKTEIGEKGINLSGGQKQRVSLARAAYNNADIYLLDDPLSAVDSHVGKHIFENVIGPKGVLKNKTRVLVTHGLTYLPEVDFIIVMIGGEITETGTYQDLLDKKGAFSDFLIRHLDLLETEDEESPIIHDLEKLVGEKPSEIINRQRSRLSESESIAERTIRHQTSVDSKESSVPLKRRQSSSGIPEPKEGEKLIEAEKSETGSVDIKIYLHYVKSVGWNNALAVLLLYIIFEGFCVASNLWLAEWSNVTPINGTQDISKRDTYLTGYGAFGIGQVITVLIAGVILALGTLKASAILHCNMLERIMKAPSYFFDTTPTGRIVNRFAKDVDSCDIQLPDNVRDFLACFFNVVTTLAVISYSTPLFLIIIVPTGFIYYAIQRFYVASSRQLKRLESVSRSPIYSHFTETITGCTTIRAFNVQERFIVESESKVDYNQRAYFPAIVSNRWLAVRLETVGNLVILFAALFAVIGRKTLTPGLVGLSVSYALQITQVLNWMVRMTSSIETNIVAVERMKEYSEIAQEAPQEVQENRPSSTWPEAGEVTFSDYQTRYREGLDLVLEKFTAHVEPTEKIGIVGRTGSGKSSLALGLFRLLEPSAGSIVIDGKDISKIGLHDLRSRLTIIPQDPVLFSGTLRINLDPFTKYDDETVWRALELAHLKPFVKGLSSTLNYEIAEGGQNLSVGQRQLVCLARALLRKSKILVLDEATAQVDLGTDELIQQTIRSEFQDSTVLTIAHRLNTILDSTRVMVLDRGQIKEFDSPETLLKNKNSLFYKMAQDAGIVSQ